MRCAAQLRIATWRRLAGRGGQRRGGASVLSTLSEMRRDLSSASEASNGQESSTGSGRYGRTLVLAGLHDAVTRRG